MSAMRHVGVILIAVIVTSIRAAAQTSADSAAIRATALDYIQGWYSGDAGRIERAVYPELAKRIVFRNVKGGSHDPHGGADEFSAIGALELVQSTRAGGGRLIPAERKRADVRILDIFEGAASVRVTASSWVDYLHIARYNGNWKIFNVLWEIAPTHPDARVR